MRINQKLALAILLLSIMLASSSVEITRAEWPVPVYYFWGDGCPICATQKIFLDELIQRYPQIELRSYEVWYDMQARQIFFDMAKEIGFEPSGVPVTIIGDRYWIGFHEGMKADMEAAVASCIETGCSDRGVGVIAGIEPLQPLETEAIPQPGEAPVSEAPASEATEVLVLPLIGAVDLSGYSLGLSTALIALVDGFNPCSLWVLSILLAMVIHSGSRKKTMLVGLTFLLVSAAVYALFIAGLFKVFTVVSFMGWIRVVVAMIALGFAAINIKDYFWFKEGLSLTVSDKHKPKIYQNIRGLMVTGKSPLALVGATVVMALGVSLVELPCTVGLPVLWTNLLAAQQVDSLTFGVLLGLYMVIYLLDELIVFGTAVITLKASKLEEKHGRVLKLVGGLLMLALALVLLVNPELMNNLTSSLVVFGAAFAAAGAVLLVHRWVLPRFGINIGSELATGKSKKKQRRQKLNSG